MKDLQITLFALAAQNPTDRDLGTAVRKELKKYTYDKKTNVYVLECPICGILHSFERHEDGHLISDPGKCLQVQCASSLFPNVGCGNIITISTQKPQK